MLMPPPAFALAGYVRSILLGCAQTLFKCHFRLAVKAPDRIVAAPNIARGQHGDDRLQPQLRLLHDPAQ